MINEAYRPNLSVNENGSTSSNYEARNFFFYGTVPEVLRTVQIPKIPFSNIYFEHAFYGVLDNDGDVIAPITDKNMTLFEIVGYTDDSEPLYLQNFVAHALNDLRTDLNNKLLTCFDAASSNKLRSSPYFNFKVHDSFRQSIDIAQSNASKGDYLGATYREYVKKNYHLNAQIKDLKTFIKHFVEFIVSNNLGPFTASRTQCHNSMVYYNNGLTFKISKDECGNDENKFDKYYNDLGFEQFCKSCIQYGFMIDKNFPFILTADLASPQMKKYLTAYQITNLQNLFKQRFYKVYKTDIKMLKMFFWTAYAQFIQDNAFYPKDSNNFCSRDLNLSDDIFDRKRKEYRLFERFAPTISENFWIRLYMYLKILDLRLNMSQKDFELFVQKAMKFYIPYDKDNKLISNYINSKFDETNNQYYFDYLRRTNGVVQEEVSNEKMPAGSVANKIFF